MADDDRAASRSLVAGEGDMLLEDEDEHLNLSFDDVDESALMQNLQQSGPQELLQPPPPAADVDVDSGSTDCSLVKKKQKAGMEPSAEDEVLNYILGTLVVRIVAARNLESVRSKGGGLGDFLFGGNQQKQKNASAGGSTNPYASVRWGPTTQRTSVVPGTTEPIWPRGEALYMDVTHPRWDDDDDESSSDLAKGSGSSSSSESSSSSSKKNPVSTTAPAPTQPAVNKPHNTVSTVPPSSSTLRSTKVPKPILTVALFHANHNDGLHKAGFQQQYGDSDDIFLGMTSVNLTALLTGKVAALDQWLPLAGGSSRQKAAVRIVCEYEPSDAAPHAGDVVLFTSYCRPADLYPAVPGRRYTVQELTGGLLWDSGGGGGDDDVLISWTSPEGWVSTFRVHRNMLICVNRHHSVVNKCQDELASLKERIAHSPMVHVVQETVHRVPDEGLLSVGGEALQMGLSLLNRWVDGGIQTTASDLTFATNWDGRHNPSATASLATTSLDDDDESEDHNNEHATRLAAVVSPKDHPELSDATRLRLDAAPALPNMPACPITGEPMRDPVVAADGHTYERSAIARWLLQSDKSPLTGSVLSHKDLVPNYMLLSSLQEQQQQQAAAGLSSSSSSQEVESAVIDMEEEEEVTAEVNIDD